MPPHLWAYFEIQKYYKNQPKFNGVYSRNYLPIIKDGAYVINLMGINQKKLIGQLCMWILW